MATFNTIGVELDTASWQLLQVPAGTVRFITMTQLVNANLDGGIVSIDWVDATPGRSGQPLVQSMRTPRNDARPLLVGPLVLMPGDYLNTLASAGGAQAHLTISYYDEAIADLSAQFDTIGLSLTATVQDVFTVPVGKRRTITTIHLANTTGATAAGMATVQWFNATAATETNDPTVRLVMNLPVAAGDARPALTGPLTLMPGDKLQMAGSAAGVIAATICYYDEDV